MTIWLLQCGIGTDNYPIGVFSSYQEAYEAKIEHKKVNPETEWYDITEWEVE